ncbi:hypothetical protein Q9L58_001461 [Maublancomyces gigas]|uniref:Uncharacterized protein n=1 Tax=Discina gigas TaxID=1032678 RepID=A0ABR3GU21_9PEZI
MSDYAGICHIAQGGTQLAEFNETTVVTVGPGPPWKLTPVNEGSPIFTIALFSDPSSSPPKVLTLGEEVQEEGIQIFVSPLQSPPSKRQQWTLEDVLATKRFPPLLTARIQSYENPGMSAGAGVLHVPLPRIFSNVAAAKNGDHAGNQRWQLDFAVEE